jgi:hypothetical protein
MDILAFIREITIILLIFSSSVLILNIAGLVVEVARFVKNEFNGKDD